MQEHKHMTVAQHACSLKNLLSLRILLVVHGTIYGQAAARTKSIAQKSIKCRHKRDFDRNKCIAVTNLDDTSRIILVKRLPMYRVAVTGTEGQIFLHLYGRFRD